MRWAGVPVARTPSNHPAGVLADVLAASGCKVSRKKGTVVRANVTLSEDGRVALVGTMNGDTSNACLEAARMLFAAYASEPSAHGFPEREITLFLPLSERFVACSATNDGRTATPVAAERTKIEEVPSAWRIESGSVRIAAIVNTTGCVVDLHLLSSTSRDLAWLTMSSIVDRRFSLPKQSTGAASRVQLQIVYEARPNPSSPVDYSGYYLPPWLAEFGTLPVPDSFR